MTRNHPFFRRSLLAGMLLILPLFAVAPPAHATSATCQSLIDTFNSAIDFGRETAAQAAVDKIAVDATCGKFQVNAQRRLAAFRLRAAQLLMARGRPAADYERLLKESDHPHVLWQAAAAIGDVRFGERRFADAAMAFDRAIEIVKNPSLTPTAPTTFDVNSLFQRAAQARLLAANGASKDNNNQAEFVKTARDDRDGTLGGIYSPSVRGITLETIPIPITFQYGTTAFTQIGEEAAREFLTALKEQHPSRVTLIGHTDSRGGAEYNMELSQKRADAVAEFLKQNGVACEIDTEGKGATDPLRIEDTSGLTQDDIYALNRRVEWQKK
jgi:outer membrane protein OmpA-like peptidoglycan-associated protein